MGGRVRPAGAPVCKCHGEPMDRNSGSLGGWMCAVKRRRRQLAYYHRKKHDPIFQLERQLREMTRVRIRY